MRYWTMMLGIAVGLAGCAHAPPKASIEQHPSDIVDLFEVQQGAAAEYTSVRIPSLAVAADGTALCWVVGRRSTSDWASMDLLLTRSSDGGKTWQAPEVFAKGNGHVIDNATNITADGGRTIHFLYQQDYSKLFHCVSIDSGKTFSAPRDVTAELEKARVTLNYNWNVMAPGPGSGAQLKSGRLLVPVWLSNSGTKAHRPSIVTTIYSDDTGKTWKVGEKVVDNTEATPNPSESIVLSLPDGRVMFNGRCESTKHRRLVSMSDNGISGWSPPQFVDELYDPICHGSMVVVPPGIAGSGLVTFVNPDSRTQQHDIRVWGARPRENLTLHFSQDGGKTWPLSKVLDPERVGYSASAITHDGKLLIVFERGYVPGNDLNLRYFSSIRVDLNDAIATATPMESTNQYVPNP